MKKILYVILVACLLLAACGVPPVAPNGPVASIQVTTSEGVHVIADPDIISGGYALAERQIPQAVVDAYVAAGGIKASGAWVIDGEEWYIISGGNTLPPRGDQQYIVLVSSSGQKYYKVAENSKGVMDRIETGIKAQQVALNNFRTLVGENLPDGFPENPSLKVMRFSDGREYLAMLSGNYGVTVQKALATGQITVDQASGIIEDAGWQSVRNFLQTGYRHRDPNMRNIAVVKMRDGTLRGLPFDFEVKNTFSDVVTPTSIEQMLTEYRLKAKLVGVTVTFDTVPADLKIVGSFMKGNTFVLTGVDWGGKPTTLFGEIDGEALYNRQIKAFANRLRQEIKAGRVSSLDNPITLKLDTGLEGVVRVQLIEGVMSDTQAQLAVRPWWTTLLTTSSLLEFGGWVLVFDAIEAPGSGGIEMPIDPSTFVVAKTLNQPMVIALSLDSLNSQYSTLVSQWMYDFQMSDGRWFSPLVLQDPEFLASFQFATGMTPDQFTAEMYAASIPDAVWKSGLFDILANAGYPLSVHSSSTLGLVPFEGLRISRHMEGGDTVLTVWGSLGENGAVSPVYQARLSQGVWSGQYLADEPAFTVLYEENLLTCMPGVGQKDATSTLDLIITCSVQE